MTMTAKAMLPAIGAGVSVRFEDIRVLCTVKDVKFSYGRPRLLVEPNAGAGSQWVELNRMCLVNCASADPKAMVEIQNYAYPEAAEVTR